jgi:hypothetical protein
VWRELLVAFSSHEVFTQADHSIATPDVCELSKKKGAIDRNGGSVVWIGAEPFGDAVIAENHRVCSIAKPGKLRQPEEKK